MRVAVVVAGVVLLGASVPGIPRTDTSNANVVRTWIFVPHRDPGPGCRRVFGLPRSVRGPAVLTRTLAELLKGPTRAERARGYAGWFSTRTTGKLRSVRVAGGVAYVDFLNFSRIIPSAASSCGSSMLLAQLDRTAKQFPTVRKTVYSFNGSRKAFYEWLQLAAPS